MGSIARVNVYTLDLAEALGGLPAGTAVFGATLKGKPVYDPLIPASGVLLIGNESRGIDPSLMTHVTHPVTIPSYGATTPGKAESLNASVAAAILCAEFRRKMIR
jgi:TrmH family RNA methyltransferase